MLRGTAHYRSLPCEVSMSQVTTALETDQYAYLTTTGRVSGAPHRIEIWFVVIDAHIWVASDSGLRPDIKAGNRDSH